MSAPSLEVESMFGRYKFTASDGKHFVSLEITREGVERMVGELQEMLDADAWLAEEEPDIL
jgi:hypothetical protein